MCVPLARSLSVTLRRASHACSYTQTQQTLIGKHDGRVCRLKPIRNSLEALCERHGASDPHFVSFIKTLLALDPEQRVTAERALTHPFLQHKDGCPLYKLNPLDGSGVAGRRLLRKYKSLENVNENVDSRARGFGDAAFPGSGSLDSGLLNIWF